MAETRADARSVGEAVVSQKPLETREPLDIRCGARLTLAKAAPTEAASFDIVDLWHKYNYNERST